MAVRVTYEVYWRLPKGWGSKGMVEKAVKEALGEWGKIWHKLILPKHFEEQGKNLYGYDRRDSGYEAVKKKVSGHTKPLFGISSRRHRSGELRRQLLARATITVKKQMRIKMRGTKYLGQRGKDGRQPDKKLEVSRVSKREQEDLAKFLKRKIVAALQERGTRRKRR